MDVNEGASDQKSSKCVFISTDQKSSFVMSTFLEITIRIHIIKCGQQSAMFLEEDTNMTGRFSWRCGSRRVRRQSSRTLQQVPALSPSSGMS